MHCWWRKAINTTHLAGLWASGMHNQTSFPTILWGNTRMIKHTDSTSITQLMCSIYSSFCYTDTKQASCLYREVNTRERNMKLHSTLILCHEHHVVITVSELVSRNFQGGVEAMSVIHTNLHMLFCFIKNQTYYIRLP